MLPAKFESPLYTAVMEFDVADKEDVTKIAMPPLTVPEPIWFPPSMKVIVPVGIPVAQETVAVKVTDWPNAEGFIEEFDAVEVALFAVPPLLSSRVTLLLPLFAVARSSFMSPLKSPTAIDTGLRPVL